MTKFTLHNINPTGFNNYTFKFNQKVILNSFTSFISIINIFFKDIINKQRERKFFVLMRLEFEDGRFKSLHKGLVLSHHSLNEYIHYCKNMISFKGEDYTDLIVKNIILDYFIIDKSREQYYEMKWTELHKEVKPINLEKFGKMELPANMDYQTWGETIVSTSDFKMVRYKDLIYSIFSDRIEVLNSGAKVLTFVDSIIDCGSADFKRIIDKTTYYIKDGKILLILKEVKTRYLTKLKEHIVDPSSNIITFDIETLLINGIHKPYLYSMYDGKTKFSWFTDSPESLFNEILRPKYKNYIVYAHNLSRFDVVFIFKYLGIIKKQGYDIKIMKKDDKIISINIINKKGNISISIRDSFLILPSALAKLAINFKVESSKLIEPVLVGKGALEHPEYAMNDLSHYSKEIEKISDFKEWQDKIIKYCETDSIALYQILIKFRELITSMWNINVNRYPTVPSLAFAIYRTYYMKDNTIPLTEGRVFDFIRESFTGGRTEMYIPSNSSFFNRLKTKINGIINKIYAYDVNSLYPYVMRYCKYPTGQIIQFEGDITIISPDENSDYYWIGDAEVETKKDLERPYLQIHHNISGKSGGIRTLAPNGKFIMKVNSPEYYNALGDYNFKIKNGYIFKKAYIFVDYINDMFKLRLEYPKSNPMNFIAKLLMNSLYGRFAMKPIINVQGFFSNKDFLKITEQFKVEEYIDLDDAIFVNFVDDRLLDKDTKVSISIASAVTSYARVIMSEFKKADSNFVLYYTDTDSVYINKPLYDYMVSNTKLGKFKLEYILDKAVFLGPKIYAGITENGDYICKVKGFKNAKDITFSEMESLLFKDNSLTLSHVKWFRSLENGEITLKDQIYELAKTSNKREFIYDSTNKAIGTKPFKIDISK